MIAQRKFLEAFAQRGVVSHAALVADVTRFAVYRWIRDDRAFKEEFDEAREEAIDLLELEARRRAAWRATGPGASAGTVRRRW